LFYESEYREILRTRRKAHQWKWRPLPFHPDIYVKGWINRTFREWRLQFLRDFDRGYDARGPRCTAHFRDEPNRGKVSSNSRRGAKKVTEHPKDVSCAALDLHQRRSL
jgi:hypothetical protein